jgi:chloride channel protein, CIC family
MVAESIQPNVSPEPEGSGYSSRFWVIVVVGGVLAGAAGGLLMVLLRAIQHVAYEYSAGDFTNAVEHALPRRRIEALLLAGVVVALARALLHFLRRQPRGLTDAVWEHDGELPFVATIVQALMSITAVGLGISLGREAPLKDVGAAISSKFSDAMRVSLRERKVLVACAAGAGMAAAYNVPFGGGLFAAEVLLGSMSLATVLPALLMSLLATATSWLFLGNQPTYDVPIYTMRGLDLMWAVLAAPLFALLSIVWVRAIAWVGKHKPGGWKAYVAPITAFACLGVLAISFPSLLGNGKGLVQRAFADQLGLRMMSLLVVLKFLSTAGCLGSGTSGGLFTPTMSLGALSGGVLGRAWSMMVPAGQAGSPHGLYAVIGSAAVLSTATLGPLSSIVMVLELTRGTVVLLVPMILATTGAILVSRRFEPRSIYSARSGG